MEFIVKYMQDQTEKEYSKENSLKGAMTIMTALLNMKKKAWIEQEDFLGYITVSKNTDIEVKQVYSYPQKDLK